MTDERDDRGGSSDSAKAGDITWRSQCPVTSALDVIGDKWSLLIVRDLLIFGTRTYSDFRESPERISTNILAARLKLLTSAEIIERTNPEGVARNNAFKLTTSGEALRPVVEGVANWSQTHLKQYHPDMHDLSETRLIQD
ncbi:MAG: DNA-binding HxlR family transcriptional regulator [Acidimicrobiales bacterium]|jgi:DNA-binding HxlR family transcriptional regulator